MNEMHKTRSDHAYLYLLSLVIWLPVRFELNLRQNITLEQEHFDFLSEAWISSALLNLLLLEIGHNHSLLIKASSSETITIKVLEKKVNFMHLSENSRENRSFLLEKLAIVCIGMPQWWNRLRVNCHYTSMRNILSRLFVLKLTVNCFFFVLNFFVNKLYSS